MVKINALKGNFNMLFNYFFDKKEDIDYEFCLNLKKEQYSKYLMKLYKQNMGYSFNIKKPQTLNELIQYLKLYDNTPMKEFLTNKVNVYDYIKNKLGSDKLVKELYKVYNSIDEIDYDELPDKFMIKLNNFCRANFPVLNKKNLNDKIKNYIKEYFSYREKLNYAFVNGFELQYKNIKPKIIVERLYPKVNEYQILCLNGNPLLVNFLDEKHHIYTKFYNTDNDGYLLDNIPAKKQINELIEISKVLSQGFTLVRIDFFMVDDKYPFFTEFTFTPYSGFAQNEVIKYNSKDYVHLISSIVKG